MPLAEATNSPADSLAVDWYRAPARAKVRRPRSKKPIAIWIAQALLLVAVSSGIYALVDLLRWGIDSHNMLVAVDWFGIVVLAVASIAGFQVRRRWGRSLSTAVSAVALWKELWVLERVTSAFDLPAIRLSWEHAVVPGFAILLALSTAWTFRKSAKNYFKF